MNPFKAVFRDHDHISNRALFRTHIFIIQSFFYELISVPGYRPKTFHKLPSRDKFTDPSVSKFSNLPNLYYLHLCLLMVGKERPFIKSPKLQ